MTTPMLALRLDAETQDAIRDAADLLGVSVSEFVRGAIQRRLDTGN